MCEDVETEAAVRRQSEAEIRHEEGFEVVTRRRCRRATGEKTELVVEEVGLCRSSSRKDVSFCGGSAVWGTLECKGMGTGAKWLQPSLLGNKS